MDDREMLEAWRQGDASAGQSLIKRHYASIFRFFFGKVGEQASADLTQLTFETLCLRRDRFRGEASVRTYLFGIARHKLLRYFRDHRRHSGRFEAFEQSVMGAGKDRSFASIFTQRQEEALVVQALRSLPLDDQLVLELKDYEGMTARELAEIFDVPPGTMAGRIRRARQRLSDTVAELANSPELRDSTLHSLDGCMRSIRAKLDEHQRDMAKRSRRNAMDADVGESVPSGPTNDTTTNENSEKKSD